MLKEIPENLKQDFEELQSLIETNECLRFIFRDIQHSEDPDNPPLFAAFQKDMTKSRYRPSFYDYAVCAVNKACRDSGIFTLLYMTNTRILIGYKGLCLKIWYRSHYHHRNDKVANESGNLDMYGFMPDMYFTSDTYSIMKRYIVYTEDCEFSEDDYNTWEDIELDVNQTTRRITEIIRKISHSGIRINGNIGYDPDENRIVLLDCEVPIDISSGLGYLDINKSIAIKLPDEQVRTVTDILVDGKCLLKINDFSSDDVVEEELQMLSCPDYVATYLLNAAMLSDKIKNVASFEELEKSASDCYDVCKTKESPYIYCTTLKKVGKQINYNLYKVILVKHNCVTGEDTEIAHAFIESMANYDKFKFNLLCIDKVLFNVSKDHSDQTFSEEYFFIVLGSYFSIVSESSIGAYIQDQSVQSF